MFVNRVVTIVCVCDLIDASLQWETIEQYFLWQLISVHTIPVEHIMPILPKLDFTGNCSSILDFELTVASHNTILVAGSGFGTLCLFSLSLLFLSFFFLSFSLSLSVS